MVTSVASLLNRMEDLELQEVDAEGMVMLYGPPGSGKTTLAGKLAQALADYEGDIAYVGTGQGWISLRNTPGLTRGMKHFPYESYDDLVGIAAGLKTRQLLADPRVVILDEHSSMAENVLDTLLRERIGTPKNDVPREVPDWTDYRPMGALVRQNLESFRDIPNLHVILVSHDQERVIRQKPRVTLIQPDYSPKVGVAIQKIMHITAHVTCETSGTPKAPVYKRKVQVQPTALVWAKSRAGNMPVITDHDDFVERVTDWVYGDMEADLARPEAEPVLAPDTIPLEGLSAVDSPDGDDDDDDEPDYVGEE